MRDAHSICTNAPSEKVPLLLNSQNTVSMFAKKESQNLLSLITVQFTTLQQSSFGPEKMVVFPDHLYTSSLYDSALTCIFELTVNFVHRQWFVKVLLSLCNILDHKNMHAFNAVVSDRSHSILHFSLVTLQISAGLKHVMMFFSFFQFLIFIYF